MLDGEPKKASDLELLALLRSLAWLSVAQQKRLAAAMTSYDVARDESIFSDSAGQGSDLFMLLSGAARLSCLGAKRGRIAIAIFPPRNDSESASIGAFSLSVSFAKRCVTAASPGFPVTASLKLFSEFESLLSSASRISSLADSVTC
jgi:hypothetical protein